MTPFLGSKHIYKIGSHKWFNISNNELLIILKGRNLEICKHSSFLIIDEIVFYIKLGFPKFQN